jgi:hypothetical protein
MTLEHRTVLTGLVNDAFERSLFFSEVLVEKLQARIEQLTGERIMWGKHDPEVQAALRVMRERPLQSGNQRHIDAARFLESTGLVFQIEEFWTPQERLKYAPDNREQAVSQKS